MRIVGTAVLFVTSLWLVQPALAQNGSNLLVNVKQAMISNARILASNWVNEFRFGYNGFSVGSIATTCVMIREPRSDKLPACRDSLNPGSLYI